MNPAWRRSRIVLGAVLVALSVLYSVWFHGDKHYLAVLLIFVLPPLLLVLGVLRGSARAAFWAGVFGLFWFSHGVMAAYSRPPEIGYAGTAIALALIIVLSSSWPGLHGRFGKKPPP